MITLKLLLVEDGESDIVACESSVKVLTRKSGIDIKLLVVKSLDEAIKLLDNSFDGAIVDLKLENVESTESYDGNEVITKIQERFRIPVAILTGTPEQAGSTDFKHLGIFKKGEVSYEQLISRFISIYKTGLTRILGGRGRIEQAMNEVFWKNLIPNINSWETYTEKETETEDALLRFTMNHLYEIIDHQTGQCLPEEMYISPPISPNLRTGSIVKEKISSENYIVLTPACDLIIRSGTACKAERFLLCLIEPFNTIRDKVLNNTMLSTPEKKKIALKTLIGNSHSLNYHWLPNTVFFDGGFVNFRKTKTLLPEDYERDFEKPSIQISNHFIKDIVARFSSYYARQGQPDFNFKELTKELFSKIENGQ